MHAEKSCDEGVLWLKRSAANISAKYDAEPKQPIIFRSAKPIKHLGYLRCAGKGSQKERFWRVLGRGDREITFSIILKRTWIYPDEYFLSAE